MLEHLILSHYQSTQIINYFRAVHTMGQANHSINDHKIDKQSGVIGSETEAGLSRTEDIKQKLLLAKKLFYDLHLTEAKDQNFYENIVTRIVMQGNEHLIDNIRGEQEPISPQSKTKYLQMLSEIDFQSIDLIYQQKSTKLINSKGEQIKKIFNSPHKKKDKVSYSAYNETIYRSEQMVRNAEQYQKICTLGNQKLEKGKRKLYCKTVGFLIDVGSSQSHFTDVSKDQAADKLFYKEVSSQKCLIEILFDKLLILFEKQKCPLYIVCTKYNHQNIKIALSLQKYKPLNAILAVQKELPIINSYGKVLLEGQFNHEGTNRILENPCGMGNFPNFYIEKEQSKKKVKVIEDIISQKIEYLCCMQADNIFEQVFDPYMLGILINSRMVPEKYQREMIFKCTYPEYVEENQLRVLWNQDSLRPEVKQYQQFKNTHAKYSQKDLDKSQIFINHMIFHCPSLKKFLEKQNELDLSFALYDVESTLCTFYDPSIHKMKTQNCFRFEKNLINTFINIETDYETKWRTLGLVVERDGNYTPIKSKKSEKNWLQAYQQYISESNGGKPGNNYEIYNSVGIFHDQSLVSLEYLKAQNYY